MHSSKYQTMEEIRYCTTYCVTTCNQYPQQSMEIGIITNSYVSKLAVHYSKDQTKARIRYCKHYCATPYNQ